MNGSSTAVIVNGEDFRGISGYSSIYYQEIKPAISWRFSATVLSRSIKLSNS